MHWPALNVQLKSSVIAVFDEERTKNRRAIWLGNYLPFRHGLMTTWYNQSKWSLQRIRLEIENAIVSVVHSIDWKHSWRGRSAVASTSSFGVLPAKPAWKRSVTVTQQSLPSVSSFYTCGSMAPLSQLCWSLARWRKKVCKSEKACGTHLHLVL